MEREEVGIARLPEQRGENGVAGEDCGAAVGVDGVASEQRRLVEVVLADQREDAAVEVEAFPREHGCRLRELGGVGVGGRPWRPWRALRRRAAEERGLHAEATLAAAALDGDIVGALRHVGWSRGGEAEEAGVRAEAEREGQQGGKERLRERHGGRRRRRSA
jgi:hypothetical protein